MAHRQIGRFGLVNVDVERVSTGSIESRVLLTQSPGMRAGL